MMTWAILTAASVILCALVGWALPAWVAARFVSAQESAGHVTSNFRGTHVASGLGLVWVVWAIAVAALSNLVAFGTQVITTTIQSTGAIPDDFFNSISFSPLSTATHVVPVLLVVGAALFGLADDVFGGSGDKGFRGHIGALRSGRLTTGMLKLIGIGVLAFVTSTSVASTIDVTDPAVGAATGWTHAGLIALTWLSATLVIALSANLLNLTDLRPGRAMKSYFPIAVVGVGLCTWGFWTSLQKAVASTAAASGLTGAADATGGLPTGVQAWVWGVGSVVCMLLLVLGPVMASWKFDLGERAMLGDAGANAMGALAGYLLVRSAPLWLMGVFTLVLLALNLASERVSFTSVIERVPVLAWLDGLGRVK
jgi:hypothetical protein